MSVDHSFTVKSSKYSVLSRNDGQHLADISFCSSFGSVAWFFFLFFFVVFFYYFHHMNMIVDRFAAKVGEPWILQTHLTKCFFSQKYNVTG